MLERAHRPLGFGAAFVRQFRLLWTSRRPLLLGVAVLAALVLSGEPWISDPKIRLLTLWPVWVVLVGPIWGFAVFHNEGPANRLYHWSLPVGRTSHTLARLAAGAAWLCVIYGVLILGGVVMGAMDGDLWHLREVSAAGWLNFFTGPLMGYLAVSLLTVASDYPIRWLFGVVLLFPLTLSIMDSWLGLDRAVEIIREPLINRGWGFFLVMLGGLGETVMNLDHTLNQLRNPGMEVTRNVLNVTHWWVATPLWLALLAALLVFLASRHPDTLPRLRRSG